MPPNRSWTDLVPLEQWKQETSVFGRRSPGMLGVDVAYATYFNARTPANAKALYEKLDAYLAGHGGYWDKVDRNTKSGGLMQFVYEKVRAAADSGPVSVRFHWGDGSVTRVTNMPAAKAALEEEAAHARLGVLYLFAKTEVSTQHLNVLLEGGFGTLGAGSKLIPAGSIGTPAIGGGSKIAAKAVGVVRSGETAQGVAPKVQPQGPPQSQPPKPAFQSISGTAPSPTWVSIENPGIPFMSTSAVVMLGAAMVELMEFVRQKLTELWDWIVAKLQTNEGAAWTATGTVAKLIINNAVSYVAKAAAPIVGAAIDIAKGVTEVIQAVKARVSAALQRAKFTISPGHPELLANAIQSALDWAIGSGLWSTLKGAGKLGLTFASAGASAIADVIVAACEFIVKSIKRLFEAHRIKAFLAEARTLYEKDLDKKPGSIVNDPRAFAAFYERGCAASPCIPMLTLNSGICGDLMQLMKMFDDTSAMKQVSQEMFDAGADYFRTLKTFGKSYLSNSGFTFSAPSDTVVQGLLSHAVNHHNPSSMSKTDALLAVLSG